VAQKHTLAMVSAMIVTIAQGAIGIRAIAVVEATISIVKYANASIAVISQNQMLVPKKSKVNVAF